MPPRAGLSLATVIGYRYLLLGNRLALGAAADLGYDQYVETLPSKPSDRKLSQFDFVARQTVAAELGRARPWVAVGGGLSIGHFTSPEAAYAPGESRATTGLVAAGAGVDVNLVGTTDVGVRVDWVAPVPQPSFHTATGADIRVFGPRVALRAGVQFRF